MPQHRLFVGGLPAETKADDLVQRFGSFGVVSEVEIVRSKDPALKGSIWQRDVRRFLLTLLRHSIGQCRGFAYVQLDTPDVERCIKTYNGSRWKGKVMKVQLAKLHYLKRLQAEWVRLRSAAASLLDLGTHAFA